MPEETKRHQKTKRGERRVGRALGQGIALSNNQLKVGEKLREAAAKDNDEEDGSESDDEDVLNGNDPEGEM